MGTASGLQQLAQGFQAVCAEVAEDADRAFMNGTVELGEEFQPWFGDAADDDAAVLFGTLARDEAAGVEAVEEAGDVGIAGDHALADFGAGEAVGAGATEDAEDVVLGGGETGGFEDGGSECCDVLGGAEEVEDDFLLEADEGPGLAEFALEDRDHWLEDSCYNECCPGWGWLPHRRCGVRHTVSGCSGAIKSGMELSTDYLGLRLANPIVVSSSPLQRDVDNIRRMEDAGAAAVVLHSLFEEQIALESEDLSLGLDEGSETNAEGLSYLPDLRQYNVGPEPYLEHIARVKKATGIPVIASLNGVSLGGWTRYARLMQQAGADAVELNLYFLPTDATLQAATLESQYCEIVQRVKRSLAIPLAVKLSPFFSSLPNMLERLDNAGADALVLFNRFYQPDFDLEALEISPSLSLSTSAELPLRLNWVAIAYGHVNADLAITGGVHTAEDVVKSMMAGAKVAMMTSAILENGIGHVSQVLAGLRAWMEEHEYESIRIMQGSLSRKKAAQPANFERANYMRVLSSFSNGNTGPASLR